MSEKKRTKNLSSAKNAIEIDSIKISYSELDFKIRQELFDELNRIYTIRKVASEEIVEDKILELEAKKKKIKVSKLIQNLYLSKINKTSLNLFIKRNQYGTKINVLERGLTTYDSKSKKGKELILQRFKYYILKQYVDSLKTKYNVKILLKPPNPPAIKINDLMTYYKGNLDSKVTFLQISDLECEMCREYAPIFNELYQKYKNSVRFGFTQFGSYTSLSAIALESAGKQGKFWEMYDSIAFTKYLPEKIDLLKIAKNIDLNLEQFKSDLESENIKTALKDNFSKLNAAGIYGTPTIMINNKLIYNSSSIADIEKMLIEEINMKK
ncbi:DsbA family protein [Polaribacter cellanae]|uniref:Thioredoxin domain-containing protein n=1 Tax=Polaribacter cellanae TaxID=2818493 RepID=A0A975CNX0_9FLAO|nr:thioredoxin domain-containing protein [Polaribacter cellanae]QTE22134.1 thioredoxin domain-containing protein [Polaribacter cellanae]